MCWVQGSDVLGAESKCDWCRVLMCWVQSRSVSGAGLGCVGCRVRMCWVQGGGVLGIGFRSVGCRNQVCWVQGSGVLGAGLWFVDCFPPQRIYHQPPVVFTVGPRYVGIRFCALYAGSRCVGCRTRHVRRRVHV